MLRQAISHYPRGVPLPNQVTHDKPDIEAAEWKTAGA